MKILSLPSLCLALFTILVATYSSPFYHWLVVVGIFRTGSNTQVPHGDLIYIEDTMHCEDLHHHLPSNLLFTACEDSITRRFEWFPPLGHLNPAGAKSQGSIHVIDPTVRPFDPFHFLFPISNPVPVFLSSSTACLVEDWTPNHEK